ncbi:hypothetical protein Pme01_28790 [Planosporangium mesophilum]|uniref:Laminin G domain-containing protein n=1 Tax=Planosporangium mesophilum TaxID=689768 RepID=A0A8J3TCC4_9ACTN|nr:hypothetical protein Pme01_28790 [Planosporangium mesophilum]
MQPSGTAAGKQHYAPTAQTTAGGGAGRAPDLPTGALAPATRSAPGRPNRTVPPATPSGPEAKQDRTRQITNGDSFRPGQSRRIAAAASANSDVYENPDGSYSRKIFQNPVNFRAADGTWQPIDRTLVAGADGRLRQKANSPGAEFAGRADDPKLAQLSLGDGRSMAYSLAGAAPVTARAQGAAVTYPGVRPGVDLRLSSVPTGVKESLVLHSPPAESSWVFPLRLEGLTPRLESNGSVTLVDGAGAVQGRIPAGYMEDSAFNPRSGGFARSEAVKYELTSVDGAPALRVSADQAWLRDPARKYPVTVDPTTLIAKMLTTGDTYVISTSIMDKSYENDLQTGTWNAGGEKAYSFLKFSGFDSVFQGAKIASTSLNLYLSWAYTCTPKPFNVNPVTQPWTIWDITYPGPTFGASIGSLTPDPGVACTNTAGDRTVGKWVRVPLTTTTFQNWALGDSNYGLAVTASQTDSTQWKKFTAYDQIGPYEPYLQVEYTPNVLPQVDEQYPTDAYSATSLTPELMATSRDPDAWPEPMQYYFRVMNKDATAIVVDSGWQTARNWTVPAGNLKWGQAYTWTVWAYDGGHLSTSQTVNTLATPVPQPLITSALAQNGGKGFEPSVANYTTSATDAVVPTVGPKLAVQRSYNSQDPRVSGAFGAAWSTVFDAAATEQKDAAGALHSVVVTYPGGQELAFGRNGDGTFAPPAGRFATFTPVSGGGYTLADKDGTTYKFTAATSTAGRFGITSVADAQGRAQTFSYDASGRPTKATSAAGRSLSLAWSTPSGATAAHVATVTTDPVTPGTAGTTLTWSYSYDGDHLAKVCPPTSATACTTYTYGTNSRYASAVMNAGPRSYWRLGESGGATAASAVLDQQGVDNGAYANVSLGQPGPLPGSAGTAAGFNGTSSSVRLPAKLISTVSYQSISMWFKANAGDQGVLFSYQADPVTNTTTPRNYTPALYVGTSGKLYGKFWDGNTTPIATSGSVTDGSWHHLTLSGAGNSQALYLDGALVGSRTGQLQIWAPDGTNNEYIGAGFIGGSWPDNPYYNGGGSDHTGHASFFKGSIAEVGFFDRPLTAPQVAAIHRTGTAAARPLTSVVRPSGNPSAKVAYDPADGTVTQVTDTDGGVWKLNKPSVSGSSQAYVGAVLGGGPVDYWRLAESGTTYAINEVNGNTATYNAVTLGAAGGPFGDRTVADFDGASSFLQLPTADIPATGPHSVSMWFKVPAGAATGGVLFSYETEAITAANPATGSWTPALYVGADGKLRGQFWAGSVSNSITTAGKVNDGNWHQVVLAAATNTQTMYLDGAQVGTLSGALVKTTAAYAYVGAGNVTGGWPSPPTNTRGYFKGQIAEVAYYNAQLSAAQAAAQFAARDRSAGTPVRTVKLTDPTGKTITHVYDVATGQELAETDALGNKTQYGYDTGGFLRTVTDPNGNVTTTEHDVRGNDLSTTTCQDRSANKCSTVYYTYYPDATTAVLTPDPRNDQLLTVRDGRSASATDNTYLTRYTYDAKGNRTAVTDPLGRVTRTDYTDGTSVAAADGGYAPAGLPMTLTTAGGAVQRVTYLRSGDVASVTDPVGKVTSYGYDGVGRVTTQKEVTDSYPAGLVTSRSYDGQSRQVSQTDPPVTNRVTGAVHTPLTTVVYDADGLVTSQTIADTTGGDASRTESSTYNTYGQQVSTTDEAGKVTRFEYDAYGNVVREVEADGGETRSAYDAEGQLLTTTLVGYTGDPNAPSPAKDVVLESQAYDPAGRLASETDAMGWVTSYRYTDNGLTAKVTRSDPATGASFVLEENGYDAAGNLISQVTNNGATTTTAVYDAAGRTTSSTLDPAGLKRTTSVTYSADDHVVNETLSDPAGTVSNTDTMYDPLGRVLATTENNGSFTPVNRWRLAESSGSIAADSAGNNPGTTGSGVSWSADRGGSAVLTGSGAITSAGPTVDTARSFTVAGWVNLGDNGAVRKAFAATGAQQSSFDVRYDKTANRWQFTMRPSDSAGETGLTTATSTSTPALNTWTHLAGVYDAAAGTMTLYVNGAAEGSATFAAGWTARRSLLIGAGLTGGAQDGYWNGRISDVQVYSRVLSASEIGSVRSGTAPEAGVGVVRTTYALDQDGLATAVIDPGGNTTNYEYDEAGQQVVSVEPAVSTESGGGAVLTRPVTYVGYNTFGEQVEVKDPNGNVTTDEYDAAGRVVATRRPPYTPPGSSTRIDAVERDSYDERGQLVSETDPLGNTTTYTYDQMGRLAKVTDPNAAVTTYTYDLLGHELSQTDPTGAVSRSTYDFLDREVTSTEVVRQTSSNHTTTSTYGAGGWLTSTKSPAGVVESRTYNAAGEVVTSTDGAGNVTKFAYDGAGREIRETAPDGTYTTTTYDAVGRPVATKVYDAADTLLSTDTNAYDNEGKLTAATDPRGTTTRFGYDATGLLISQVEPVSATDSITTTFGYDQSGHRTRMTDGRGNAFLTTYNSWGLPESQIEPATTAFPDAADRTFTVSYDAAAQPVTLRSPGGVSVSNTFDSVGNLTRQAGTGAEAATTDRTFGYDAARRMTSASGSAGATTFSYDDRDDLLSASGAAGNSSFTYNPDGEIASRTDAAGTTTYGYDSAGRVASAANPTTGVQATYAYNSLSQVARIGYAGSGGNTRSFGYDAQHRLVSDELKSSGGTSIAKITYGYDANGNEISKAVTGFTGSTTNTYTYDLADRLTSWNNGSNTVTYGYDRSGNRVQVGGRYFSYDQRNQLTGDGTTGYKYTARGTLASTSGNAGTLTTKSDAFGQVVSQDASTTQTQQYTYDGLGRLIRPGFAYSGLENTLASDGSATYTRDAEDDLLGVASGSTQAYAWTDLHTDLIGQFTATGTALTGSTSYDPLGNVLARTGMLGQLGYQSEWTDPTTGRVNMLARWYNPDTGQFDSRDSATLDPTPDSVDANRFVYANQNPLTEIDPTGHWGMPSFVKKAVKSVSSAARKVVSKASNTVRKVASTAKRVVKTAVKKVTTTVKKTYHAAKRVASKVYSTAKRVAKKAYTTAKRAVKKTYHAAQRAVKKAYTSAKKYVAKKINQAKKTAKAVFVKAKQAGKMVLAKTKRTVQAATNKIKDAYQATTKFVKDHKNAIIEGIAIVGGIAAGLACTAVTAGVGAVACMVGAGALINLGKDAAQGDIHDVGDALGSAGTGGVQGLTGVVSGYAGGYVAATVAKTVTGRLGDAAASTAGHMLAGAAGGVADAGSQLYASGQIDPSAVAMSMAAGAVEGRGIAHFGKHRAPLVYKPRHVYSSKDVRPAFYDGQHRKRSITSRIVGRNPIGFKGVENGLFTAYDYQDKASDWVGRFIDNPVVGAVARGAAGTVGFVRGYREGTK